MESLGKDGKGLTVFGHKGSTDQHSYVQQLRDGRPDYFAAFVRVLCPRPHATTDVDVDPDRHGVTAADYLAAFQEGTAKALHEAGRPSLRISIQQVDERSVGAIVALFERAVGYYAAMIGINAYDQPGVEAGKKAAAGYLDVQQKLVQELRRAGKAMSAADLAKPVGTTPELAADILARLALNGRFGIRRKGEQYSA
jgi:glucose-6-phosphate isomerase